MDDSTFKAAGFRLYANGGNLTAWRKESGAGRFVLITDSEGGSHDLGDSHVEDSTKPDCYLVGLHDDDECLEFREAMTARDAIEAANGFSPQ